MVLFQFSHPPDSIRSFPLSSPSRIVIDVHGPVQNVPSRIYQAEDALLTHVRTGSHPQRLRLVLDLSGQTVPAHSVEHHETRVLAKLGKPGGEQDGGPPPIRPQVLFRSLRQRWLPSVGARVQLRSWLRSQPRLPLPRRLT